MKWPPSPVNRETFELLVAVPAVGAELSGVDQVAGHRAAGGWPNRDRISTSSGAKRRLKPTMSRSLPVCVRPSMTLVQLVTGQRERLLDEDRPCRFPGRGR